MNEKEETIKQAALNYESTTIGNVADLEAFDVNMKLHRYEGVDAEGKKFAYLYVEDKDNKRYRVPYVVLDQIKGHLEEDPDASLFRVKKTGEGLKTRYQVFKVDKKK